MRVVQIGLGSFGRGWLPIVGAAEGVELVGVIDTSDAARAWAAESQGVDPGSCLATLAEATARLAFDAVVVVTPPMTHRTVAEEALVAGKHVLVEKPLATSMDDARALVVAADAADRTLMVSQNYRFRRPARAVREALQSGAIGEPLAVEVVCRRDTRAQFPPGDFRYRMRHPFVLDMAIHHVDLLRATTGQDVRRLWARSWPVADSPYVHDPAVAAMMELSGGATVTYRGDWAAHGGETSWNGDWSILGEHGRIVWRGGEADALDGTVTVQRWGDEPKAHSLPALAAVDRAGSLAAFREAVETGREPEASGRDNIRSLAIVLAMVESIERGVMVEVDA